jgi:hypothetical protein
MPVKRPYRKLDQPCRLLHLQRLSFSVVRTPSFRTIGVRELPKEIGAWSVSNRPPSTLVAKVYITPSGSEAPQSITGVFADGSLVGLEDSTYIAYSSDTPAVATVDWRGVVTAVAPGRATITITYATPSSGSILAKVPVAVPPPLLVLSESSFLYVSESEEFAAALAIDPNLDQSVKWSINPKMGSIDDTGDYTAPPSVALRQGVTVTATSVADPSISPSARVWILPGRSNK